MNSYDRLLVRGIDGFESFAVDAFYKFAIDEASMKLVRPDLFLNSGAIHDDAGRSQQPRLQTRRLTVLWVARICLSEASPESVIKT